MDFTEKKLSTKQIFSGRVIDVAVETVLLPNQKQATREIVHHHGAVGILTVIDHKILLVKQWREPLQQLTLEIPAGKVEPDCVDLKSEALRELNEETGYTCSELQFLTGFYSTPGFSDEYLTLYYAPAVKPVAHKRPLDPDEFLSIELLTLDQAQSQMQQGLICDAKTILAIMFWQQLMGA